MTNRTNLNKGQLVPFRPAQHTTVAEINLPAAPATLAPEAVAVLERRAARVTRQAAEADMRLGYLGIQSLFIEPRLYSGNETDWVIAPVLADDERYVPKPQRAELKKLQEIGLEFPCLYIAHEVAKQPKSAVEPTPMTRSSALELVGPTPDPHHAVNISNRLGDASDAVMRTLLRAIPVIGLIAAAPFLVVGGAIAGLATMDPVVFGVVPQRRITEGQPAAWFVLTRWDW